MQIAGLLLEMERDLAVRLPEFVTVLLRREVQLLGRMWAWFKFQRISFWLAGASLASNMPRTSNDTPFEHNSCVIARTALLR